MIKTLDKDEIAKLGIEGGWTFGLPDFVRYGDLDNYNHVNNKTYHAWFECLRVLYLQDLDVNFSEDSVIKPVVRSAGIVFNAAMYLGEEYITLCKVSKVGRTSFKIDYAVWCDGTFRVTGDTVMVMVNEDATETRPIPDDLRAIMIERDGAQAT